MKTFLIAFAFLILLSASGCTKNARTRFWGGTETMNLPKGKKLVIATWKDSDLWILTRPMTQLDSAQSYDFNESSSFGVFEGTLHIQESK